MISNSLLKWVQELPMTMGRSVIAFDYKRINWASAAGYEDFGWEDQDVYAIGYQHTQDNWAIRTGYNYAKSPIVKNSVANDQYA